MQLAQPRSFADARHPDKKLGRPSRFMCGNIHFVYSTGAW